MQVLLLLLATYALLLVVIPILLLIFSFADNPSFHRTPNMRDDAAIFRAIVLAPILETFFIQFLVFKVFQLFNNRRCYDGWYILTSAILFGIMHTYNIPYMINTFFIGIVLAYGIYFYKRQPAKAFWTVTLIHALRNAISTILVFAFSD